MSSRVLGMLSVLSVHGAAYGMETGTLLETNAIGIPLQLGCPTQNGTTVVY